MRPPPLPLPLPFYSSTTAIEAGYDAIPSSKLEAVNCFHIPNFHTSLLHSLTITVFFLKSAPGALEIEIKLVFF